QVGSTVGIKATDKGKGIMQESEPSKKIKKMVQIQMTVDQELAKKLFEEEQAKQSDTIKRYQTLKKKSISVAQARKNMMIYLKNMAGYKMNYFKGMSYHDIGPIFEVEYNKVQTLFKSRDVKEEKSQKVLEESAKKTETEQVEIESSKKQKLEDDAEKEELQGYLTIMSEDKGIDVASLATKQEVQKDMIYCIGGDLKTMMEPNAEDEIWRNQEDWNLISWRLHNFCGVHVLLMQDGLVIHMLVVRKYPLLQDILSKMLSRRLEVDYQSEIGYELIRFVKSQLQQ
ncbi:hypothetical protein Tco_0359490, partial [Tanacetum coccineum]